MKHFKVVINFSFFKEDKRINVDETFDFTDVHVALSFARGYKEAIMWYVQVESPCCPQIDGYHYWDLDGRDMIAVLNEEGEYVTSKDM